MVNEKTIKAVGPTLANNGYYVVPIAKGGKRPRGQGWQDRRMTAEDCLKHRTEGDGVGILCGVGDYPICALDFDIEGDVEFAEAMENFTEKLVGKAMKRVGKSPKFLLVYRAMEAGWGKNCTPTYKKDGRKVQLEVLGKGQQFVAYHIHPDTGKPYEWPDDDIDLTPEFLFADYLQVITKEQIAQIKAEFDRQAIERGYEPSGGATNTEAKDATLDELAPPKGAMPGVTIESARKILKDLNYDFGEGSHDKWLKVGMALHHQFNGSDEALALWDELSREFPEAYNPDVLVDKWKSFKSDESPDAVTFRSCYSDWKKQKSPQYFELSQDGSLARLLARYGDRIVFVLEDRQLCAYDEETGTWPVAKAVDADVAYYIRRSLQEDYAETVEAFGEGSPEEEAMRKFSFQNRKKLSAVENGLLDLLRKTKPRKVSREVFDTNYGTFAVANGVVDLKTGALLPYSPSDMISRQSPVVYDPEAKCPTWERVIYEWMGDDQEMVDYVQCLFGHALTGKPRFDKMAILYGFGCNGKSVFNNTLVSLFGPYATVVGEETLLGKSGLGEGGKSRSDIAKMNGTRLVVCSETSELGCLREADIKRLTGREKISARSPFSKYEAEFRPTWQLCMATNYAPEIRGDDDGIWRRLAYIQFPRNFDKDPTIKKDIDLESKLEKELPGILNWLLKGYQRSMYGDLPTPKRVEALLLKQRSDSDLISQWLDEMLVPEEGSTMWVQEAFANFNQFLRALKMENRAISQNRFTTRLKKRIPEAIVDGAQRKKKIVGYRLATAEDFDEDPFS